jgi:hypothetical protein
MTEDEAFEELEQRLKLQRSTEYLQRAHIEATKFISEHASDLGIMTLRKAFELGYRYGYTDAKDPGTN